MRKPCYLDFARINIFQGNSNVVKTKSKFSYNDINQLFELGAHTNLGEKSQGICGLLQSHEVRSSIGNLLENSQEKRTLKPCIDKTRETRRQQGLRKFSPTFFVKQAGSQNSSCQAIHHWQVMFYGQIYSG